jgi:LPXTG-site transpeptidase (sortase) family protein
VVCGAGIMLAYNVATKRVVLDIPGVDAAPGPSFTDSVAAPERLLIPKINVDAHIKAVGVDANGKMLTPGNATDVAWYKHGPYPGMPGSAVISGHLNTRYAKEAVFYDLDQLQPGDELQLRATGGQTLQFKVTEVKRYAYDTSTEEIFLGGGQPPRLVLITCAGDWVPEKKIYNERLAVFAERVE